MSEERYSGRRLFFLTYVADIVGSGVLDWKWQTYEEQLSRHLSLLQPGRWSACILWPAQPGIGHLDLDRNDVQPVTFMQAAGRAECMTIEWKTDRGSAFRQYVLGRGGDHSGDPSVEILHSGGDVRVRVFEDEAFAHDEATRIFTYYTEHNCPPPEYSLRDLKLPFGPDGKGVAQ